VDITIKRIDPTLDLPKYQTSGSVFFDLLVRQTTTVEPGKVALLPLNVVVQTPPGYFFLLVPRSSTPIKKGLLIPNGIGVIDQDYCGDEDEVRLLVFNFTDAAVTVERGERVAQAGFVPVERAAWTEVDHMPEKSRGGFGSTGER
jgi:dUTP pyrophosphatase